MPLLQLAAHAQEKIVRVRCPDVVTKERADETH
jgi:hypothetical protein